jgi:hypothetical protein
MIEKRKNWNWVNIVMTSLLGAILFMVTAFYDDYRADKKNRYDENKERDARIEDTQKMCINLAKGYEYLNSRADKHDQKDMEMEKEILELWKCQNRSGNSKTPSILTQ